MWSWCAYTGFATSCTISAYCHVGLVHTWNSEQTDLYCSTPCQHAIAPHTPQSIKNHAATDCTCSSSSSSSSNRSSSRSSTHHLFKAPGHGNLGLTQACRVEMCTLCHQSPKKDAREQYHTMPRVTLLMTQMSQQSKFRKTIDATAQDMYIRHNIATLPETVNAMYMQRAPRMIDDYVHRKTGRQRSWVNCAAIQTLWRRDCTQGLWSQRSQQWVNITHMHARSNPNDRIQCKHDVHRGWNMMYDFMLLSLGLGARGTRRQWFHY